MLNTVNIPTDTAYLVVTPSASWDEWHWHFGHVAILRLKQLRANGLVTGFDVADSLPSSECGTCIAAKMAQTGFLDLNDTRASYAGEKTHSDLWGPYKVQSLQGSSYFISFTDDYSRRITVKFLKLKSETEREVKNYIATINTQLGKTPKAFKWTMPLNTSRGT